MRFSINNDNNKRNLHELFKRVSNLVKMIEILQIWLSSLNREYLRMDSCMFTSKY